MGVMRWGLVVGALLATTGCSSAATNFDEVQSPTADDAGPAVTADARQDASRPPSPDAAPGSGVDASTVDGSHTTQDVDAGIDPTEAGPAPQPTPDASTEAAAPTTRVTCVTTTGRYATGTATASYQTGDAGTIFYAYPITPDDGNGNAYWGVSMRYESATGYVTAFPLQDQSIAPCVSGSSCIVADRWGGSVSGHCL